MYLSPVENQDVLKRAKDTSFSLTHSLNLGGSLLSLARAQVMGIMNLSPDSFFDGGFYPDLDRQIGQCARMLEEGAAIIDVGAMSTRPGAEEIPEETEIARLIPLLEALMVAFPGIRISVDTYRQKVAEAAVKKGAVMINDISGGAFDPHMPDFIAESGTAYVLMHTLDKPRSMQHQPQYDNVSNAVMQFFGRQLDLFLSKGARDIILDPGFGFGKTLEHNYILLQDLPAICSLGFPVLAGISRKSMIYKTLDVSPSEALPGTLAAQTIALMQGAAMLRVHDVAEAMQSIRIFETFTKARHLSGE